jgi:hypothetical protein
MDQLIRQKIVDVLFVRHGTLKDHADIEQVKKPV